MKVRSALAVTVVSGLVAVLMVALVAQARAGDLEPPGPPAPTMKTLDQIPPSWDQILSAQSSDPCNSARFKCVLNGQGALDKETGLVWQTAPGQGQVDWGTAGVECIRRSIGGRYGWRLPRVEEFMSLFDGQLPITLPAGHPFVNVVDAATGGYWTATRVLAAGTTFANSTAWQVLVGFDAATRNIPTLAFGWCVRGGSNGDMNRTP